MDGFVPRNTEEIKHANLGILQMLGSQDGRDEVGQDVSNAIRTRIREEGFLGRIMERRPVTVDESQVDLNRDRVYKVVNINQESSAAVCNLTGQMSVQYLEGKRARIDLWAVKSDVYEKTEEEIIALDSFIVDDVVKSLYSSIEAAEDDRFIQLVNKVITDNTYNTTTTSTSLTRDDLTGGLNMLVGRELRTQTILMHEYRRNDILAWDGTEIGQTATADLFYKGLTQDRIFNNVKWLSSLKTFLNPKYVYYFAPEEYLGRFYEWKPVTVVVEKRKDIISFYAKEWIGFGIINTKAVGRLDLA